MSEMVKRVRAAVDEHVGYDGWVDDWDALVRAAIKAMRVPTPQMLKAASEVGPPGNVDIEPEQWAEAIDVALGKPPRYLQDDS